MRTGRCRLVEWKGHPVGWKWVRSVGMHRDEVCTIWATLKVWCAGRVGITEATVAASTRESYHKRVCAASLPGACHVLHHPPFSPQEPSVVISSHMGKGCGCRLCRVFVPGRTNLMVQLACQVFSISITV